jgi:hypothetical protein
MRKAAIFILVLFACQITLAQTPRLEVFGGYSFLHEPGANFNGWNGAATINVYRCVGITADFSGNYWSRASGISSLNGQFDIDLHEGVYTYTFGPSLSWRNKTRFTPFVRFLAGGSHISVKSTVRSVTGSGSVDHFTDSVDHFTVVGGGGLDITLNRRLAIRPVQLDYHGVHSGGWMNSMRYSAGVVFRFGERK